MGSKGRFHGWCFTINNYTEDDIQRVNSFGLDLGDDADQITFGGYSFPEIIRAVWAYEVGAQGTNHIQGYLFHERQTSRKIISRILPGAYLAPARGSWGQQLTYIVGPYDKREGMTIKSKPYNPDHVIIGSEPEQGRRSDIEAFTRAILDGATDPELIADFPVEWVQFGRMVALTRASRAQPRTTKPIVTWIFGPSGKGKTSYITKKYPPEDIYVKDHTIWWNGYIGQPIVLVDDFSGKWDHKDLLRCNDYAQYQSQFKGGYVHIAPTDIYFTTTLNPTKLYHKIVADSDMRKGSKFATDDSEYYQFVRRVDHLIHVNSLGEYEDFDVQLQAVKDKFEALSIEADDIDCLGDPSIIIKPNTITDLKKKSYSLSLSELRMLDPDIEEV